MDSYESRPDSSASTSSSSSNSNDDASSHKSRSKSRSKSSASRSSSASSRNDSVPKSPINGVNNTARSPSPSKSLRSLSLDEERNVRSSRSPSKESARSAASSDDEGSAAGIRRNIRSVSRNQSISPVRKALSARTSSVSSVSDDDDDDEGHLKTDEISDGEMESSDKEDENNRHFDHLASPIPAADKDTKTPVTEPINMSHEDLSDVSDLESPASAHANEKDDPEEYDEVPHLDADDEQAKTSITDLRQKLDERKNQLKAFEENNKKDEPAPAKVSRSPSPAPTLNDKLLDKKNDEDALDFEAEEGECNDTVAEETVEPKESEEKKESDGEIEEGEELEEGEVSDDDEKRPEETEPKPVCRFYTRGQCTWGMSCRFLHPGVTDKGNYTMFDMIRPVPVPHTGPYAPSSYHDFRNDRPSMHHALPPAHHPAFAAPAHARQPLAEPAAESAWERGLRTAKEMMRKAIKRKEQDMDFEDKKMNLSASQDELEKDNYYIRDRASPEASPPYPVVPKGPHYDGAYSPPPVKYPPRPIAVGGGGVPPPFEEDPYGRSARYRELPPHRMPQYEDEIIGKQRRIRPAREVIVQRAEPVGRGDEWNDPWMRSKSPGRGDKRSRRDRRSYSSNSSYSSTSTSRSDSSSNSSRSPSPNSRRRRFNSGGANSAAGGPTAKSPIPQRRHGKRSPTPTKRRHSPVFIPPPEPNNFENKKEFRNHSATKQRPTIVTLPIPSKKNQSNPRNPFKRYHYPLNNQIMSVISLPNASNHMSTMRKARRSPPPAVRKRNTSPPIPEKRAARISPVAKRKRLLSPVVQRKTTPGFERSRKKRRSSSSGSGSSDSSGSDTGSSYSSSSSSSSRTAAKQSARREKTVPERKVESGSSKKIETLKKRSPAQVDSKSSSSAANLAPSSNSTAQTPSSSSSANSKKTTRREELLKQLRAVEDAIARKRQKVA